jgi:hypothetical protein
MEAREVRPSGGMGVSLRDAQRAHRRSSAKGTGYSWECLSRLARILVRCGHSPNDLVSELREICRTLRVPRRRWDPTQLNFISDLPHVIARWHSDPRYLGPDGRPAALPLRGRGPSLGALIESALPGEDARVVTRALMRVGGLRRRGSRYLPTRRHLRFRQHSGRVHSANALLRMLRTVERNLSGAPASAIFERAAVNPRFPVIALAAFHRDLKARASLFLQDIDGNMGRHEARSTGGRRTRVGVEVFAFEEPLIGSSQEQRTTAGSRLTRRRATPLRRASRKKS